MNVQAHHRGQCYRHKDKPDAEGKLVDGSGGDMLETQRFRVKWSQDCIRRGIGGTFNMDPDFYNAFRDVSNNKMHLAFYYHE